MTPTEDGKLSKEEVDALLEATREEELPAEKFEPVRRVQSYNFQQPSRFNKSALEHLRKTHEVLAQGASEHLSRLLRSAVKAQLISMDHMRWENLLEDAGASVVAFVFTLEPLGHRGVVTVDRMFAAACLDRMTGGQGGQPEVPPAFTEMDVRVLRTLVRPFVQPLPSLWERLGRFSVQLGALVEDLQALDLFSGAEDFFQVCFLVQSAAGAGRLALAVPFQAVRSLPPETAPYEQVVADSTAAEAALRESVMCTPVTLTVLLGGADVKVARLIHAEPGDVIKLNRRVGDPLDVKINDKVKLRCIPGVVGGEYAAKLFWED